MSYSVSISKNNAQANYVKISLRARPLHALLFARSDFSHVQELAELYQPGTYVLMNDTTLYVGEADNLLQRLETHTKTENKKWWTNAICFHTMLNAPDPLNKAMVKYLEHALISKFKSAGVTLDNQSVPNEPFLSEIDKNLMDEEFLPSIFEILDIFNIFKPSYSLRGSRFKEKQVIADLTDKRDYLSTTIENNTTNKSSTINTVPKEATAYSLVDKWFNAKTHSSSEPKQNRSKTEQIKSKHYCEIKLDGRAISAKNWSEMYVEVFKYLVSVHGEDLLFKHMPNRISKSPFKKEDTLLTAYNWTDLENNKWYLLTEIGTEEKRASIKKVAQICHCDLVLK